MRINFSTLAITDSDISRFWSNVDIRGPDECWLWNKSTKNGPGGYGQFSFKGKKTLVASRFAYFITNGVDPDTVLHTCDNPQCNNPKHLKDGTQLDNILDMISKDRNNSGSLKGETNPNSKFNEVAVRTIRFIYNSKLASGRAIARAYRVSQPTISAIVRRRTWAHVE